MSIPPSDDIWLGALPGAAGSDPGPGLVVEMIDIPAPLDDQFGMHPKKTAPEPLGAILFPPAEATAPESQLYAVLDGSRIDGLLDRLEQSGLPHLCLFKGQSAREMTEVAPRIVRLDPESTFVRNLFTRGPAAWQLWDDAPGIFLRSRSDLETMQVHLRHFTRIRDEDDQWFYFRFWEPAAAAIYFGDMASRPELARLWFQPRRGLPIDMMAVMLPDPVLSQAMILRPRDLAQVSPEPAARLTRRDIRRFAEGRRRSDAAALAKDLAEAFPDDLDMCRNRLVDAVSAGLDRLMAFGFRQRDTLFVMLAWEVLFGPGFESMDPDGQLAGIMRGAGDEAERFERLKQRMEQLG